MATNQIGLGNTLTTVGVIGESFGITNPGQLSWLIAGYSLTIGTFILIGGRLGDEFGNKKMFVLGISWYSLWSLAAGLSVYSSHVLFIFARVFQGMGPALTLPNGLAILGQSYSPGPRKNMAFAWFGGSAPFGAIAGFSFGGLFALAWWPWIYWSQAIALAGVAVFSAWAIPPLPLQPKQNRSIREKLEDLDIPGGLTGVTSLVLFNFAWNQAFVVGWQETYVYVCLILGVLVGVVFFYIELNWVKSPILPLAAFNSDIAFVFGCTATGWACFGIWVSIALFKSMSKLTHSVGLLHRTNRHQHWWKYSSPNGSLVYSYHSIWFNLGSGRWQVTRQDSPVVDHGCWTGSLSRRIHPGSHSTRTFDLLDVLLLQCPYHHRWHGYFLSGSDDHFFQRGATGVPGHGRKRCDDHCQLQHFAWTWNRWYRRDTHQSWWQDKIR